MKKSAFTLMEILVALAIVGVLAVLTVPRLVNDTNAKSMAVTLKATYGQVADGIKQAMIDQSVRHISDLDFEGTTNQAKLSVFMNKYFDVAKNCEGSSGTCFGTSYKTISEKAIGYPFSVEGTQFAEYVTLSNGASVAIIIDIVGGNAEDNYFLIDVNGAKAPNVFGRDVFVEYIKFDGSLGVSVLPDNISELLSECKGTESSNDAYTAGACLDLLKARDWNLESYLY